ncbi:A/G-specific adenine glycosylase [Desulfobulbus marinus]|nr:A/G-specific adenine glycosylase [Desulfogranum marinum]
MLNFICTTQQSNFQDLLLKWFHTHKRSLPWREEYIPYHVWISEIMGQQTQMERVADYFLRWIARFPSVAAVAAAPELDILKAWEGLGYYSRARNIQKTAQLLMEVYNGDVPASHKELLSLPGIGPYTAAAILSIGFNQPWPLLDANVERVFSRLADIDQPLKQKDTRKALENMAAELLYRKDPRNWNQALMEFGALVCTPKNPNCDQCPVQPFCLANKRDTVDWRPVPREKKKVIDITMACGILRRGNLFFIQQRLDDDIWGGLWEFPGGRLLENELPEQAVIREVAEETEWQVTNPVPFRSVVHYYTRYRVTLHSFWCQLPPTPVQPVLHAAKDANWVTLEELGEYPYPAGHRNLVQLLQRQ